MNAAASARLEAGAEASARATGRLEERTRALLAQAIRRDLVRSESQRAEAGCVPPSLEQTLADRPGAAAGPGALASEGTTAVGKTSEARGAEAAERALELVEQVQTFLRSGRPALSLTLRGAMAGRVGSNGWVPELFLSASNRGGAPRHRNWPPCGRNFREADSPSSRWR